MPLNFSKNQLIIVGSLLLVIAFFVLVFSGILPGKREDIGVGESVQLTMWGIFDDPRVWQEITNDYEALHPNVKIDYQSVNPNNYEEDLVNALAATTGGPDVFMVHNTWLPKHSNKLAPIDESQLSVVTLRQLYPQVVEDDFVREGRIFALPLSVDTLALYYNKDTFNNKKIVFPPNTWDEFASTAVKLRQFGQKGVIIKAGAAIGGTPESVNRATDIVTLLMMQNGTAMLNENRNRAAFNNEAGLRALDFYAQFSNPKSSEYTWTDSFGSSVDEFSKGNVAMMLNYSYQVNNLKTKNPFLNFGIAPVPQPKGAARAVNFPNYWGLAVSDKSSNTEKKWAWDFVAFATANEGEARKYSERTNRPPALRFLVNQYLNNENLGVFAGQALTARSWYQVDNIAIEQIFSDMIESTVTKELSAAEALRQAEKQVTSLLQ